MESPVELSTLVPISDLLILNLKDIPKVLLCFNRAIRITAEVTVFANMIKNADFLERLAGGY